MFALQLKNNTTLHITRMVLTDLLKVLIGLVVSILLVVLISQLQKL
jgi:hypothetical protein